MKTGKFRPIVPNDLMVPVGATFTEDSGRCADNWTDSDIALLRAQLPTQYHAVPVDALRRQWINIRKRGTPGYRINGHGPEQTPPLSPEYKEALQLPAFREYFNALCAMFSNRCAICNTGGRLDPHHRTYDRLGSEEMFDCIPVCRKCHRLCDKRRRVESTCVTHAARSEWLFDATYDHPTNHPSHGGSCED
jgi:hypothetical protein